LLIPSGRASWPCAAVRAGAVWSPASESLHWQAHRIVAPKPRLSTSVTLRRCTSTHSNFLGRACSGSHPPLIVPTRTARTGSSRGQIARTGVTQLAPIGRSVRRRRSVRRVSADCLDELGCQPDCRQGEDADHHDLPDTTPDCNGLVAHARTVRPSRHREPQRQATTQAVPIGSYG
jgi:hypothetical protein